MRRAESWRPSDSESDPHMEANVRIPNRVLNCVESRDVDRDWGFINALGAGVLAAPPTLPEATDLREDWWKIGDQGRTGSCVGWATADSVIRWHFVTANRLAENQLLSVRFIWMASKETDQFISQPTTFVERAGTSLKAALDVARKYGMVRDSILPFRSGRLYPQDEKTFYALAAQLKIASYFNLGRNLDTWRSWLAAHGPILTRLNVDATWQKATQSAGYLDTYKTDPIYGGHAVALVGYDSDSFLVRNSWGTDWGDKGFAHAAFEYARKAFTEAYGVSV